MGYWTLQIRINFCIFKIFQRFFTRDNGSNKIAEYRVSKNLKQKCFNESESENRNTECSHSELRITISLAYFRQHDTGTSIHVHIPVRYHILCKKYDTRYIFLIAIFKKKLNSDKTTLTNTFVIICFNNSVNSIW